MLRGTLRRIAAMATVLVVCFATGTALGQGRRVALVVGIDSYQSVEPLTRARNDAVAVAERLQGLGFEVVLRTNADRRTLNAGITEFEEKLRGAEVGFFFFAGHGVEIRGTNVLLPADVPATLSEGVVMREGVLLSDVSQLMSDSGVRYSVLVVDACRDNPLPRQAGRSLGRSRGLGRVDAPRGTYVVYSAGVGEAALDRLSESDTSPNSVFTRHLLPALAEPGVSLDGAVKSVRERVRTDAATVRHQQNPAIYDQSTGELYLAPAQRPDPPVAPPSGEGSGTELLFWQSIQGTSRREELEAYLARWPDGIFAPLARARIAALASAAPTPPSVSGPVAPPSGAPVTREPVAEAGTPPRPLNPLEVRRAQQRLAQLGLDPGPADGAAGARTAAAARVFRSAAGMPPAEGLDEGLAARLFADPAPARADLARALFAAAVAAREAKAGAEAARLLEAGLRLEANNAAALLLLGDVQRETGRTEAARLSWTRARAAEPDGDAGRTAAARLAALPPPSAEARAIVPPGGGFARNPAAGGSCSVTFVGSRIEPGRAGYTFSNSCAVEMLYRPSCAGSSDVGRGELSIPARSTTTVWATAGRGGRGSGTCTIQSARPRG